MGAPLRVQAGAAPSVEAGYPLCVDVQVVDADGNPAAFVGAIHVVATDPGTTAIADVPFVATDQGHTACIVLRTAGAQTLALTDVARGLQPASVAVGVASAPPAVLTW